MSNSKIVKQKAMVIGISPEYIYPGKLDIWRQETTYYAANLGASLITNALMRQLSANYVSIDDFQHIDELRNTYDVCILALATHITPWRDVSIYADIVEKLDMKTIVVSAGIQDYDAALSLSYEIHPSMRRILRKASESSRWIGVRGHYTATVLRSNGFKNVVPIGCPTMYWPLVEDWKVVKRSGFSKPLVVYHRMIALNSYEAICSLPLLGQDWQDQPMFTDTLKDDVALVQMMEKMYSEKGEELRNKISEMIKSNGHFFFKFKEWFDYIGQHDFVLGSRLHGTIAALVQNVPAVLIARDLRMREIDEFFRIPSIDFETLNTCPLTEVYQQVDFTEFNALYRSRYRNYVTFLNENGLEHNLAGAQDASEFAYTYADLSSSISVPLLAIKRDLLLIQEKSFSYQLRKFFGRLYAYIARISRPIRKRLKQLLTMPH